MNEDFFFEDEVRRIARLLWPEARFAGAAIEDGRERDGVFKTSECIHVLEATTSTKKAKAEEDSKKIRELLKKLQTGAGVRALRGWFVTKHEPTAEQREAVRRVAPNQINAVSFAQFQSQLIDGRAYLAARDNYPFGSVRDPKTQAIHPTAKFVEPDLVVVGDGRKAPLAEIQERIEKGERVVLLGDYGAGKSMTLRQLYQDLRARYLRNDSSAFPVYLNLRDHYGQENPAEVLERHARNIGFENHSHLVRAWRAGFIYLLLDGFDELVGSSSAGIWTKLRDYRRRATQALRKLVEDAPAPAGIVIAGRPQFFDNPSERKSALGLLGPSLEVEVNEFTEQQLNSYLKQLGETGRVPAWLPARPLLVGSLAAKGALSGVLDSEGTEAVSPAEGWDYLLGTICEREARIDPGIEGETVRRIIERLALRARVLSGGLGPIPAKDILKTYEEISGYPAEESALAMLQRLPGLTPHQAEDPGRSFVDEAFADACRAGDLSAYVLDPFGTDPELMTGLEVSCGPIAIEIVGFRVSNSPGIAKAALQKSKNLHSADTLRGDLVRLFANRNWSCEEQISIAGTVVSDFDLSLTTSDLSRVTFVDAYFGRVELDADNREVRLPKFRACFIGEVDGFERGTAQFTQVFDETCHVDECSGGAPVTNNALLDTTLQSGVKVVLTILRKLYLQKGSARRENAFFRGLEPRAKRLVPQALALVEREGLAVRSSRSGQRLWMPVRSDGARVNRIISQARTAEDPLLVAAAELAD